MTSMRTRTAVLLAALLLVPAAASFALPTGSTAWIWANQLAAFTGIGVMLVGILRLERQARTVWWLLWSMLVVLAAADIVYDLLLYGFGVSPIPSPSDVLYLASYGPQVAALVLLVRRREPGPDGCAWLDTALVTLALGAVTLVFVVHPLVDGSGPVGSAELMALAYPVLDLVTLAVLLRLLMAGTGREPAMTAVAVSTAITLVADLCYNAILFDGAPVEATAWTQYVYLAGEITLVAAVFLRGADAIDHPVAEHGEAVRRFRAWLIALGTLTPVLLLLGLVWPSGTPLVRIVAAVTATAIVLGLLRGWRLVQTVNRQSAMLAEQARTDALTGLPNRRTWDHQVVRAVEAAERTGAPLTMALLDLDRFKAVNDTGGHQAGDALLQEATRAWVTALPGDAFLARYGGEEFALLLPGRSGPAVGELLDTVRSATPQGQTVSIGWASLEPDEHPTLLLLRADQALFRAKRDGRDRVVGHPGASVNLRHAGPVG